MSYFNSRSAGQTVARMRELETIRSFLTGQGLFSAIDLVFAFVFIAVMFAYSWRLTLIVLAGLPVYIAVAIWRAAGAARSRQREVQQGRGEPAVPGRDGRRHRHGQGGRSRIDHARRVGGRLAAYVKTSFAATVLGQQAARNSIWSKVTTAALLLFGAMAVIHGELTVGALVAFNMIAAQAVQPILRLSQIWQDFQQPDLDRAFGRHSEHGSRTCAARPSGSADAARRDSIPQRQLPLPPGRAKVLEDVSLVVRPGGTLASLARPARASRR